MAMRRSGLCAAFSSALRISTPVPARNVVVVPSATESNSFRAFSGAPKDAFPKRPMNAYMKYFNEKRSDVSASIKGTPQEKVVETARLMGKMWKELPAAEKKRYEDAARADKEAFARQWPDGAPRKPKRAVKRRDPNAPKRAPSAYNLFVQAFYSKTPMNDMPFAERSARVAKEWAQADKKQWQDMAAQEKLRIVNSK